MRNVCLKLAASLLVFVAAAQPAAADDKKNYPGTFCHASGSADDDLVRTNTGRVLNAATAVRTVYCPAVKDYGSLADGTAWVIDLSPSDQVYCQLRAGSPETTAMWARSDATTNASYSTTPVKLTFGSLSPTGDFAFYLLVCDLPAQVSSSQRSGIASYQLNEND